MFFLKKNLINNNLLYKTYSLLRKPINKRSFYILYSGGLDSGSFLFLLKIILGKKNIKIIHINHNLNKLDNKYKNYCKIKAKFNKVDFFLININKKKIINKFGVESSLREKRNKSIKYINKIKNIKTIWVNHNKDDIIETLLIQLLRGSNKLALTKIFFFNKAKNKLQKINSLIKIKKIIIKKFIIKNSIKWIEDKSNLNFWFLRNKLRIKIIPKINYYINNYEKKIKKLILYFNKIKI